MIAYANGTKLMAERADGYTAFFYLRDGILWASRIEGGDSGKA